MNTQVRNVEVTFFVTDDPPVRFVISNVRLPLVPVTVKVMLVE
jgi:hypothetical protein